MSLHLLPSFQRPSQHFFYYDFTLHKRVSRAGLKSLKTPSVRLTILTLKFSMSSNPHCTVTLTIILAFFDPFFIILSHLCIFWVYFFIILSHLCILWIHLNGLACIFFRLLPLLHAQVDVCSVRDIRNLKKCAFVKSWKLDKSLTACINL